MLISLTDNQYKAEKINAELMGSWKDKFKEPLKVISGKSLNELCSEKWKKDHGEFLVFSFNSAKSDLDRKDNFVYVFSENTNGLPLFQTGNVMGFLGLGDNLKMQITSRFDKSDKNYFLHYMLQKVCNVAFAPNSSSAEEEFFDFLYYLFPGYLKKACAQGIFRAYVTREYNDANVRGPIDVARHIRHNVPFNGKIAYHTREYTTDNKITQLVRHTIEYIRSLNYGNSILTSDNDVRDDVNDIIASTPSYSKNSRMQVIARNLHPVTHPYYTAYEPLRKICLAILLHKKISYGESDKPITGILFDGASLWEEYLAKVFEEHELGLTHSNNRENKKGIKIFKGGRDYYPDFYKKESINNAHDAFVLDAKYKRLCTVKNEASDESSDDSRDEKNGVYFHYKREDLFQMLAYMHCLQAKKAVLVSPYRCDDAKREVLTPDKPKIALGYGGDISIIAVPIPVYDNKNDSKKNWEKFKKDMQEIENRLYAEVMRQMLT